MAKLLFLDVETTGTDPARHGIVQLSGIIEIDGIEKERFDYRLKPFPGDLVNPEALKVNGLTMEQIRGFEEPLTVYQEFKVMIFKYIDRYDKKEKFHIVGYNSRFDDSFLRRLFEKCLDKFYGSYFWWPAIDVSNMAALKCINSRYEFKNFKLITVAKAAGIEIDPNKLHDAMYDVNITKELFYLLIEEKCFNK